MKVYACCKTQQDNMLKWLSDRRLAADLILRYGEKDSDTRSEGLLS